MTSKRKQILKAIAVSGSAVCPARGWGIRPVIFTPGEPGYDISGGCMSLENCTGYPEMPNDSSECVAFLRGYQAWRRWIGAAPLAEEGPAMPHPKSIGFAIDMAIRLIEQHGEVLAEFGAYKEGSEEAFGVLVEQKKSAESRLAQMQQTISVQQSVICNMREKLGAKRGAA